MKKSLLATVAAVALIAGAGAASAAEGAKEQPKAAAPAGHSEMQKAPDAKAGADVKSHATTGAGSAEMSEPKAGADVKGKANGKAEMKSEKAKPSTTGAGAADEKAGVNEKAGTKSEMNKSGKPDTKAMDNKASDTKSKSSASEQKSPAAKSAADSKSSSQTTGQAAAGAKGASVNLTTEQKTKIRTTVIESKGAPKVSRSSINFNISVGTVVPRDRVHYVAVTPTLIDIHPEWRGHYYFVVDEEIIIVDSRGRIVAVLDV